MNGQLETLKILLEKSEEKGIDIFKNDGEGNNIFHLACVGGCQEMLSILLNDAGKRFDLKVD